MKATKILTKEEYDVVWAGGCKKWGIDDALRQTENSFWRWWLSVGQKRCSFCKKFDCEQCILWSKKKDKHEQCLCFDEYQEVKKAAASGDYPAFMEASALVYAKIVNTDYDAYLKFVGAYKGEKKVKTYTEEQVEEMVQGAFKKAEQSYGGTARRLRRENEELRVQYEKADKKDPKPKEPEHKYEIGEIVHWDGTDGEGGRCRDPQLMKIEERERPVGFKYKVEYFDGSDYWYCNSLALRPATEEELDEYYTVELDGVKCRFYEDNEGDVFHIHNDGHKGYMSTGRENAEIVHAILKKAGILVMSYKKNKGDYKPPKEKA